MEAVVRRGDLDGCPGVVAPHHAADGELVRIRVPGGALSIRALRGAAAASAEFGDGRIGLTSRGNLQVRGVQASGLAELVTRLRGAGLLPGAEFDGHERVRNILGSPMSGRRPGSLDDVDELVRELDAGLCARPELARLPGRFLFAVDDGSEDVAGQGADVVAVALGAGEYAVRASGWPSQLRVQRGAVVAALLAVAVGFLHERDERGSPQPRQAVWRLADLPAGGAASVLAGLIAAGWPAQKPLAQPSAAATAQTPAAATTVEILQPGLIEQRGGRFAVCAVVGLGMLDADQCAALAASAELSQADPESALRLTPWRRVVVRDLQLPAALAVRELLSSVGLITTPGTAWSRITACAGRPGCAKSITDVHSDARVFTGRCDPVGPAVHWAGCERGCGTPTGDEVVQLLAGADGYRLRGELSANDRAAVRIEPSR